MTTEADRGLEELQERVESGVRRIEDLLLERTQSNDGMVTEAAQHLLEAGGKRFRPLLTMLTAQFGDSENEDVVKAGVVVELTHLATLYHDDVMDEAPRRRGAPSANSRWDNSVAILVGDFLFARASSLVADLGTEAVRIQAETFAWLVHGQIKETVGPREAEDLLDHYLKVVADKTGSLIATSALFGAKMSGAGEDVQNILLEYGERIGVAFQLADDIIDIMSESEDSGKTPGTDLREGVLTLPTLYVLRSEDSADADLKARLREPITDELLVDKTLAELRKHSAMEQARDYVRGEAEAARTLLADLPTGPARSALDELCDRVVNRVT